MEDHRNDNKRIAKNTLIIYINLFLNMLIGVISSRFVLQALGVSDFGLYNVAGGIALLFVFIANALSGTTFRFVNIEMGKPDRDVNRIFNVCRVLHIALAFILLLIIEIGGIWYINNYINVEPGKEADAMFVFQVSAFMVFLGVMNVPYSSLINAMEKFFLSSTVNIIGKLIEFSLVIWLLSYNGNRVRAYAIIMITSTVVPFIVYHFLCFRKWPSFVRWKMVREWSRYKEAIVFSNYNLLSGAAGMARSQGSALLINFFFGTVVNGSFAVAKTIDRHIYSFTNRLQEAAGPQVYQSYSSGDKERVYFLTSRIGRYSLLLMALAFFPLWAEMDFILHIWLAEVPAGALLFCRLTLLMVFVSVTDGGIGTIVNASGKIAPFQIVFSIATLSCIPIGFFVLKAGAEPYILLILFIIADILWRVIQYWMAHRILQFPILLFCRDVYIPVISVCLIMGGILYFSAMIQCNTPIWHLSRFLGILLATAVSVFFIGLKGRERKRIINRVLHHNY